MTKVKFGVGVAGLSGSDNRSAGGQTWSKNNIVRTRVVPLNPQTNYQTDVRLAFAFLNQAWLDLSDANRLLWEAARISGNWQIQDSLTGVSRNPSSAKALFIEINMNQLVKQGILGAPAVTNSSPPAQNPMSDVGLTSVTAVAATGVVTVNFTGSMGGSDWMVIRATPPLSGGKLKLPPSALRLVAAGQFADPEVITAQYAARHGSLTGTSDKVIWFVVEVIGTDGRKYSPGTVRTIIT